MHLLALLQLLTIASVACAAAVCLYYLVLAAAALMLRAPVPRTVTAARHRFAILIPAHNEEAVIADVLASCADLDYPPAMVGVFVVADNCTDGTAAIAAACGAVVLERHDPEHRGKGQALAWALERVLPERPDAVLILDADCRLDPHALQTFDDYLAAGDRVLQSAYVASNPDDSICSYLAGVANRIENDWFYRPKSRLGLSVLLRGTGMVFHRAVLERYPWRAHSVVEDVEYTVRLCQAGIRVRFVPEVRVLSAFPAQQQQMNVQRTRWVGGNFRLGLARFVPLLLRALRRRRPILVDLGWTLLVSIRSLVLLQLLLTLCLCALLAWLAPGTADEALLLTSIGLIGAHTLYFLLGAAHLGISRRRLALLVQAPVALLRLLGIALVSLLPGRVRSWDRTPR